MSDLDNEEIEATKKLQEKTADEMFEELEYKKFDDKKFNKCKYEYDKAGLRICIEFFKYQNNGTVIISMYDKDEKRHYSPEITMQELQAINKKCQELRVDLKKQ